jgi:hypothetical protein
LGKEAEPIEEGVGGFETPIKEILKPIEEENDETLTNENLGFTIYFLISNIGLFKKLKTNTGSANKIITFKITGYNAFRYPGTFQTFKCNLITQHKPYWLTDGKQISAEVEIGEKYSGEYFNSGENIVFTLNRTPESYNNTYWGWDNDSFKIKNTNAITGYIISALNETQEGIFKDSPTYTSTVTWEEIPNLL